MNAIRTSLRLAFVGWLLSSSLSRADEGMWLFNDLPKAYLKEKYNFEPTDAWARHLMLSSVRFNSGGSASFVSNNGLVITNHHVGADTLHKLSTPERNIYQNGFYAATPDKELKAPDLELNQLVEIEDVTSLVNAAVKPSMDASTAFRARRAVMGQLEKESLAKTKLRSDVVTLYGGGRYHLYRYKKYTDVRLVFAPESAIAFFGGDADNFEYPRYCLDFCLFRVYENDKPAEIEHFLKFSPTGVKKGELVLVSGNPGRTSRIFTVAALKYLRDIRFPKRLDYIRRLEVLMQQFSLEDPEKARRAKDDLFGIQNARKAYTGMLQGLQDPQIMAVKRKHERDLLSFINSDPKRKPLADAWQEIAKLQQRKRRLSDKSPSLRSRLFDIAQTLVEMAEEDTKPSDERLREYRDSARESLEQSLYSTAPIYMDLEQVKLADALSYLVERLGGDHPLVRRALGRKSPTQLAADIVQTTKLSNVADRRKLAAGKQQAIQQSKDPLIQLAIRMNKATREYRSQQEEIQELERQAYAKIAEATFAWKGTSSYPDATFTLRLAFGPVSGYELEGEQVAPWTTMDGAFGHAEKHNNTAPWQLPQSWLDKRSEIKKDTPFNFVCTADIIGGNSGSPVVNREGKFVGIIFDGNIQSLTADYIYTDKVARSVSVNSNAILESLRTIYGAGTLADQLLGN